MGYHFQVENFNQCWAEIDQLTLRNSADTSTSNDDEVWPMKLCADRYKAAQDTGQLCVITARNSGDLVGYCSIFVGPHLHYTDVRCGHIDSIYVQRNDRPHIGKEFLRQIENRLRLNGIKRSFIIADPRFGLLLEQLGWAPEKAQIYGKWLGN